jgi:hypothetical protein
MPTSDNKIDITLSANQENRRQIAPGASVMLKIGDTVIDPVNISLLIVREWALDHSKIPRLELIVEDDGGLTDWDFPYHGRKLEVSIIKDKTDGIELMPGNSLEGVYKVLDMSFTKTVKGQSGETFKIFITALLDIPDLLDTAPNTAYENKTSFDVIKTLATELGLGFFSNMNNTNDSMTWIKVNASQLAFMQDVTSRSFISAEDATFSFITKDYVLKYMSIAEALKATPKPCIHYPEMTNEISINQIKATAIKFGYTEQEATDTIWYSSFAFKNMANSTEILNKGSESTVKIIDLLTGNHVLSEASETPDNTQVFTDLVIDNHSTLISTTVDPNNEALTKKNVVYSGILPGTRTTTDNVYGNDYYSAKTKRNNLISGLMGVPTTIEVNANLDVVTFDTLDMKAPVTVSTDAYESNEILDGLYIVLGIIYILDAGIFKKILNVHKLGFGTNPNKK